MFKELGVNIVIDKVYIKRVGSFLKTRLSLILIFLLTLVSIISFYVYYKNGLGLAYNDARSHLDIGRRVVEGLKPGLAQLGSVWLPLLHILMVPTVWNDFMWHSGLSGSIVSMVSFVTTGLVVYKFLENLGVGTFGKLLGVFVFVANMNILYLQSTAMTELLLLATMTLGAYELVVWQRSGDNLHLIKSAFWIMISTLTRYDGWFLFVWAAIVVIVNAYREKGFKVAEGLVILFSTLAGFGVFLWLLWNLMIFKDPLFFAFGPFSAKAQQDQLDMAGVLQTKYHFWNSIKFYFYALVYNSGFYAVVLGVIGGLVVLFDKKLSSGVKIAMTTLLAPYFFNVLALFMGHSVLLIQGLSGDTWFNVRYGIMLAPSLAVFIGYLVDKTKNLRWVITGLLIFVTLFSFISADAVTIDDARVGSSQKNVSEVSGWLRENAKSKKGFVLISAASHDAIIFSSGMPMKRFIHEGTGLYWENALAIPDRWARWIIMRTYDDKDLVYRHIKETEGFERYNLVDSFPFADIYEIKPEYVKQLNVDPVLGKQR